MKLSFWGGVHPADRKELSKKQSFVSFVGPKYVTISMSQHIGAPCTPLVTVGDYVKKGQKIGDGTGLCVPVHASVSGNVVAVEPRKHPSGRDVMAVVIENDNLETPDNTLKAYPDYTDVSAEELLAVIREAGIVGMGGATFSTNVKLASGAGKVLTLIANGCECEPYITADDMLLQLNAKEVLEGMRIVCRILNLKRAVLAVEDNKKEAIAELERILRQEVSEAEDAERKGWENSGMKCKNAEECCIDIELCVLPTRYPQGAEKQLVQTVTGNEIAPGALPASVGCVVMNVTTLASVYRAVCLGQPVIERFVTVSGEGVRNPGNFKVRIGTSFEDLVNAAGGLTEDVWKVIAGGPMMGVAQADLTASMIKGTNSILCLSNGQNGESDVQTCIRCGKCMEVCPMRLQPLYLYAYEQKHDVAALNRFHVMDCIECGCCAYTCPGKLPLVERFRNGKSMVKEAVSK